MKKNLLLGCALLAAGTSFAAIPNDGCTYEAKDGIEMKSVWCASRLINPEAWTKVFQETGLDGDYNRRCCVFNDKIYVTHGEKIVEGEGESATESYPWWLVSFDLMTGELIDKKPLMFENQQFQGLLTAMNIGTDDFGHIWVSGFNGGAEGTLIPIYVLDPETATLTRPASLSNGPLTMRLHALVSTSAISQVTLPANRLKAFTVLPVLQRPIAIVSSASRILPLGNPVWTVMPHGPVKM